MSMKVDCDCWHGEWIAFDNRVVRVCTSCFAVDDGAKIYTAGCGCIACVHRARDEMLPILLVRGLGKSEKPIPFVDRLAQHLLNTTYVPKMRAFA